MTKVAVCVPSGSTWMSGFGLDLAVMLGTFEKTHKGTKTTQLFNIQLSVLPKARKSLVDLALKADCTHVLFLDADARFTKDTLDRLLAHDLDFVACNAVRRALPCTPTTQNAPGWRNMVWTSPDSYGLEEVHDHVGLHTALIRTDVFRNIEKPWFVCPYMPKMDEYQGEDVWFCHRVIDAGYQIWIDHDLSQSNFHTGTFDYGHLLAHHGRAEYEREAEAKDAEREAEKASRAPELVESL